LPLTTLLFEENSSRAVAGAGERTDSERAAQVLLLTRLNLCSGAVCDSLAITCTEAQDGVAVLTLGDVADSLDVLLCANGNRDDIRRLVEVLRCVTDDKDGDEGEDEDNGDDARVQNLLVKALNVNPARLGDGPLHFAVSAAAPSMVQLRIYDVRGRLIAEPMHSSMVVGNADVTWNGTDLRGQVVSPGTYFYRAIAGGQAATGRLLIVR
jgi:hypothetical protein